MNNNEITTSIISDNEEMRGLWVSYISLDMTGTDRSFDDFKERFTEILSKAKELGCNTLIVQVRPFCDALYKSEIFPYSHVLSGTQGVDCGYDALEYMCKEAHDEGIKIHAWINPYRVSTGSIPSTLSNNNPFVQAETVGFKTDTGIYLDPCKKAVRKLIRDGVAEIVNNYDVDGIQFDDYFYPSDCEKFDIEDFNAYRKATGNIATAMEYDEWRMNNVNLMISGVYQTIKAIKPDVVFGISPQGNIDNNAGIFADIYTWCQAEGYIDYICPQMYFSTNHPNVSFEEMLIRWNKISMHRNLNVYIGLGVYKAGTDADNGTWLESSEILATQLSMLRQHGYDGYMLYDYNAVCSETADKELEAFCSEID